MRKVLLLVGLMVLVLVLSTPAVQAASCGDGGPTGGHMWTAHVSSGYWYTITVTNLHDWHPWGTVSLEIWDSCWLDSNGWWHCSGFVGKSGPYGAWASYTFPASHSTYYVWVVSASNSYELCIS